MHFVVGDIRVDHPDRGLHHIAAVVDLRDNAIGLVLAVQRDSGARPFGRRILPKQALAQRFAQWLVSPEGQAAIGGYEVAGEQLFHPSAAVPK